MKRSQHGWTLPVSPRTRLTLLARYSCVLGCALLGVVSLAPSAALARTQLHPTLFALPNSEFPQSSRVVRAGIEGNRRLERDDPRHFGVPAGALQRMTGYYMDAVEGDPAGRHAYTSYLISIFRSARQARLAYDERWDTWFAATYYSTPAASPVTVGDVGANALFRTLDPTQPPLTELLFGRGAVLIEVFQGTVSGPPTSTQLQAFWSIATQLDALAQHHPHGI